ncbi:cytochrome P450 [Pyrrhoderma noxium]|uniref:Cytochrome P450 n=1 Tax=Pyrrhoderma noxium TaxID=2282107 RepID=A0A286UG36_9AGAM|nr:cytochrome P450 [Pyrrhoderma noxium]
MLVPTLTALGLAYAYFRFSSRISPTIPYAGEGSLVSRLKVPVEYGKDPVQFLINARKKLGDVFCVDLFVVKIVFYLGVEGNKMILKAPEQSISFVDQIKWALGPTMSAAFDYPGWTPISFKFVKLAFTKQENLMNYKEHCLKIAREHIENWAKDETVPLFHSVSHLVLSCLVVILIGEDFYRRHGKEVVPMMANFERDLQNPLLRVVPGSLWWITGPGHRLNKTCTRFDKLVSAELHDILENPDKHKGRTDYFYYVVSQVGDKYAFCYGRHIVGLVFGGHANAAMTIPWLFLHAHRIPGALDRIREELDLDPTARRPYLDACLRETSRLYTNTSMMRMTTTSVEIAGHTVPQKTLVACSPLATQRLNKSEGGIFVDSNRWDPSRFLEDPDAYSNWFQRADRCWRGTMLM